MEEATFLQAIAESSHDPQLVRAFAEWLLDRGDKRGEYLQLELDRRASEIQLLAVERKFRELTLFGELDSAWLDKVFPLQILSPMVGTFYSAHTPNSDPYVKVGDVCTPSTIVGIIEAMKVFNEIPADASGVISKVLVASGDTVDYAKPLFCLDRLPRWAAGG